MGSSGTPLTRQRRRRHAADPQQQILKHPTGRGASGRTHWSRSGRPQDRLPTWHAPARMVSVVSVVSVVGVVSVVSVVSVVKCGKVW